MTKQWYEITVNLPLSLLETTYNFIWPYVNGLSVEKTDKSFLIKAYLFSLSTDRIMKKLEQFLRVQAKSFKVESFSPVAGPVVLPPVDSLIIVPAPTSYIPPFGLPIFIQRGRAFGLGCHPCTIYCLQGIQYIYAQEPDTIRSGKILDAGIGTGILSIVAAKLGAENIIGVDINDESIKEAQENIKFNNITKGIQILHYSVKDIKEQFNLILANLYGYFLSQNASHFVNLLSPKGWLLVSGISVPHDEFVVSIFIENGLLEYVRYRDDEWSAFLLKKP